MEKIQMDPFLTTVWSLASLNHMKSWNRLDQTMLSWVTSLYCLRLSTWLTVVEKTLQNVNSTGQWFSLMNRAFVSPQSVGNSSFPLGA